MPTLRARCAKSRLFSTTGSHGSQGPEFCTLHHLLVRGQQDLHLHCTRPSIPSRPSETLHKGWWGTPEYTRCAVQCLLRDLLVDRGQFRFRVKAEPERARRGGVITALDTGCIAWYPHQPLWSIPPPAPSAALGTGCAPQYSTSLYGTRHSHRICKMTGPCEAEGEVQRCRPRRWRRADATGAWVQI